MAMTKHLIGANEYYSDFLYHQSGNVVILAYLHFTLLLFQLAMLYYFQIKIVSKTFIPVLISKVLYNFKTIYTEKVYNERILRLISVKAN